MAPTNARSPACAVAGAPEDRGEDVELVVAGCGGNIGSHLAPHLGRIAGVTRVTLIDPDCYEAKNIRSQDITARDIGKPKALVQAARLRRINPRLQVRAIVDRVERVPLGVLRADVLLGGLDSRGARRFLAAAAWHLGLPYIDAGVEPGGLLVRVNVYLPGPANACLQCTWDPSDYALLEQSYPCDGASSVPPPTNAPSSLGAMVAALQVIECQKLLRGERDRMLIGRQLVVDAAWHKHYVTVLRPNPQCRFDHEVWSVEQLPRAPQDVTIASTLALAPATQGQPVAAGSPTLHVPGASFIRTLRCSGCGATRALLRLSHRLHAAQRTCAVCGARMVAGGFDMVERLRAADLSSALLARSLRRIGVRAGDIVAVESAGAAVHFEVGSPARRRRGRQLQPLRGTRTWTTSPEAS